MEEAQAMKSIRRVRRFLSILHRGQRVSACFLNSLLEDKYIPNKLKKQLKQAAVMQKGGTIETLNTKIFKCGGGGCVYELHNISGEIVEDILLKLFKQSIAEETRQDMLSNIKLLIGNFEEFVNSYTSFAVYNNDHKIYSKDGHYGYFVKKCQGDLDNLDINNSYTTQVNCVIDVLKSYIQNMNNLGIVHGDIKFPNILYKENSNNTCTLHDFYLHDFDDVAIYNPGTLLPIENLKFSLGAFSPVFVCPFYLFFKNTLVQQIGSTNVWNTSTNVWDTLKTNIGTLRLIDNMLNTLSTNKTVFTNVKAVRDEVCKIWLTTPIIQRHLLLYNDDNAFILYIMYLFQMKKKDKIKQLVLQSDLYSFAISLLVKSFSIQNTNIKQSLRERAIDMLIDYFSLLENSNSTRGGNTVVALPSQPGTNYGLNTMDATNDVKTLYMNFMKTIMNNTETIMNNTETITNDVYLNAVNLKVRLISNETGYSIKEKKEEKEEVTRPLPKIELRSK